MKRLIPLFFIVFVIFGCERENVVHTETYKYTGVLDSFLYDETHYYDTTIIDSIYYGQINSDTIKVIYDSLNFEYHFQLEDTTFQLKPNRKTIFYIGYEELFRGDTWDSRYTLKFYVDSIVYLKEDLISSYVDNSHWYEKTKRKKGVLYRN